MKKLQNNFTTPEQSKRLLELGVPAASADCYYDQYRILQYRTIDDYGYDFFGLNFRFIPCWSVGRLIEIYEICTQRKFNRRNQTDDLVYLSPLEDVLMQIEHNAKLDTNLLKWIKNLLEE
jgi:hypothetical protein